MKKLSFVLALILVLTCAVLAACGGDSDSSSAAESGKVETSKPATSKPVEFTEAPVESSKPVESSEPEVSEPVEEPAEPIAIVGEVISKGCQYEVPGGKGYVVKDDKWPANYAADLTDGIANAILTYDSTWFSFNSAADMDGEANTINGVGAAIIDLGDVKSVTGVKANVCTGEEAASIAPIISIVVSVSEDGKTFSDPFKLTLPTTKVGWAEGGCQAINARYVKVEFTKDSELFHMFVNEIEVYGN